MKSRFLNLQTLSIYLHFWQVARGKTTAQMEQLGFLYADNVQKLQFGEDIKAIEINEKRIKTRTPGKGRIKTPFSLEVILRSLILKLILGTQKGKK